MNRPLSFSDPRLFLAHSEAAFRHRLWQRAVSKKVVSVTDGGDHYKVLHATKGYRYIHKRRLGLANSKEA